MTDNNVTGRDAGMVDWKRSGTINMRGKEG